jgi:hypothetical protein
VWETCCDRRHDEQRTILQHFVEVVEIGIEAIGVDEIQWPASS